mmetsp:Transcript_36633/g.84254  ORF Transcript_36633/g.84254 Transcript_36633/m.84254 type:complete len:564 (-) Transcript_36633:72-1763(-)
MDELPAAVVNYVMHKRHATQDSHEFGTRIDGMWLQHAKLGCIVELCNEVLADPVSVLQSTEADGSSSPDRREAIGAPSPLSEAVPKTDDAVTDAGSCEEDGGSCSSTAAPPSSRPEESRRGSWRLALLERNLQERLESFAMNSLDVTHKSRSFISAEGGFEALEKDLREYCALQARELAPHVEGLLDPSSVEDSRAAIQDFRHDMETEFEAILAAKTANAEIMVDLREQMETVRRQAWSVARRIIRHLLSSATLGHHGRTSCLVLAELASCSSEDQGEALHHGAVDAVVEVLQHHCKEDEADLQLAAVYALRSFTKDMLGEAMLSELDSFLERIEGNLLSEMSLRYERAIYDIAHRVLTDISDGMGVDEAVSRGKTEVEEFPDATLNDLWVAWCGCSERESSRCSFLFDGSMAKVEQKVRQFAGEMNRSTMHMFDRLLEEDSAARVQHLVDTRRPEIAEEFADIASEVVFRIQPLRELAVRLAGACQACSSSDGSPLNFLDDEPCSPHALAPQEGSLTTLCTQESKKRSKFTLKRIAGRGRKALSALKPRKGHSHQHQVQEEP